MTEMMDTLRSAGRKRITASALVLALVVVLSVIAAQELPAGIDWHEAFRPAARAVLDGQSPYTVEKFYAAPWGLVPLLPMALLPEEAGRGILLAASLVSLTIVAHRLGARPITTAAFLMSPPVLHGLLNANIDWLAMLGFVAPPQIGLLLVTIKPQVGIGLVVYWLVQAWRQGRVPQVIRVFWPLTAVSGVSFILFGFWPLRFGQIIDYSRSFNASLWPTSIPIGLVLLVAAIRRRDARYAIASSPCLSPHVVFHSYAGVLACLLSMPIETIVAVIGLWVLVILRLAGGV
jgi:hypothetical protein